METDLTAIWTRLKNTFVSGVVMAYQHPMASLAGAWTPEQARGLPSWLGGYTPASEDQGQKSPPPGRSHRRSDKGEAIGELHRRVQETRRDLPGGRRLSDEAPRGVPGERRRRRASVRGARGRRGAIALAGDCAARPRHGDQAEIAAVRSAASAAELAAKAAQEQKTVTDAMAARKRHTTTRS